ncbi:LuxR C-terminal-related transcriptional regulator [Phytohabitans sp. LJ34]|uniref:LuxR C-terminal-related transcriptional regulator n=1 Tax=Phytohabitans sp. LJ34 TaxID=3452217 RepID=UPI003F8B3B00
MDTGATSTAVPSLGRWGLSAHADLVYRTLTVCHSATCRELARHLDVQVRRIAEALDELAAVGAVRRYSQGRDWRWTAVAVDRVLSLLHRRRAPIVLEDRHRRHLATVAGLSLDRIPADAIRRMPTRASARARIAELATLERHEHLAINTEDPITADAAAAAAPLDRALLARGVRMRTIGRPPQDGGRRAVPPAGSEHREADDLPLKLMVFDRQAALFPADPTDFNAGAVELSDPDAVAHLTQLFYRIWSMADDPRRQETPHVMLTIREQAIVALLSAGVSEEEAASRLGLSRRTVVYALRALMDRLGVENRFQLALVLGAAHAVPIPTSESTAPATPEEP